MPDPIQPQPGGSPTAADSPTAAAQVDVARRELAELQRQVRDLRALQSSGRWWVWGSTALIILMFSVFMYGTYARIRDNFGQPAMQQAIREHGQVLMPLTRQMLMSAGRDVLPVYRDAIVAVLHARGPAAATAAVQRLKELPEQGGKELQDKLRATFDAAVSRIEPEFKSAYPNVSDERRQQIMQAFVMDEINEQNKRIASRVDQLYTNDLIRMQAVLEKYDVPQGTDAKPVDQQELEKRFLHTMVALLDDQVDAAYPAPVAPDAADPRRRPSPATRPTAAP
jgi:hypothetical protein